MKKFLTFATFATVVVAAMMSSCQKNDSVPVISVTTQPAAPAALTEGAVTGSLTVAATATEGATLSYQWYTNTTASSTGGTKIDGATAASYTLPTTLAAGTYYYFCEVGAAGAKAVRTNAVTVTVGASTVAYPITGKAGMLDWSLDEAGTLTVSGTGAMPDYVVTRATAAPWSAYANEIKVVVIVEGVTNVGAGAFAGLTVLVEVTLPESVESIGTGAFAGCAVLVEINIPTGTEIGDGAFEGCDELPEVTIPVTGVSVEPATLTLTPWAGDTETLTATVTPANATDNTVSWSSDKPDVATVDTATGVVTAVNPGTATITATAGGKTATCTVTVESPPDTSLQDALDGYEEFYTEMKGIYTTIDDTWPTLAERQSVGTGDSTLDYFWRMVYNVIYCSNTIIERITEINLPALQAGLPPVMSDADMEEHGGRAALYRGMAYLYLATLFGDVPVMTGEWWMSLPESSANEVLDYALGNFDMAAGMLSGIESAQARFGKMLVAAGRKDYQTVAMLSAELMNSGTIALRDVNGDGKIDLADNDGENTVYVQSLLLSVEAYLALGDIMNAAMCFPAGLVDLYPGATAEEIRAAVNGLWPSWNDGMKFMNEARWGNTASWGKYALMPIPSKAIMMNRRLTQNPGW